MSSESDTGRRLAMLYGANIASLNRVGRLAWLRDEFDASIAADACERRDHAGSCPDCRAGAFCLKAMSVTPAQNARHDRIKRLRGAMALEARDHEYADRARRVRPVLYETHVDGFCAYWQNLRHRLFVVAGHRCQRCREHKPLEAHHLHYDTLGFEELRDLQALCRDCHGVADRQREAQASYSAGMATYAAKKYGDAADSIPTAELEAEFDEWLEDRE